jgi:hypothetical protein
LPKPHAAPGSSGPRIAKKVSVQVISAARCGHYGRKRMLSLLKSAVRGMVIALGLLLCAHARAADSAADMRPVTVVLHSDSSEPTLAAVQSAVAEELGVAALGADSQASAAARGVLTVTYRSDTKELAISYSDATRGTVTRIVPAPERAADVPGLAALVAGNLVRDQAADFLNQAAPAPAPAPTPAPAPAPSAAAPTPAPPPPVHWLGNASFFYPLATNVNQPELETNFDFNLLYGHIGRLNGLELGTVSTVSGDAQGLQASVLTNLVGGRVSAGQFSLAYNRGRSLEGVQLALVNRADESMQGLQLGGMNMAGTLSKGVQLSALNFSGDFEGLQVGLVNIGKHVRGMQVGLINIADDMDGVPIGLVSVSREGGVHPVVWSTNTTYGNVGIKFATRYTYTMLSGAVHGEAEYTLYGGGLTIGGSIPIAKRINGDVDVQGLHLFANTNCCRDKFTGAIARAHDQSLGKVRVSIRFELLPHLSLFAGSGITGRVTYPLRGGDTEVRFTPVPEFFGGIQL